VFQAGLQYRSDEQHVFILNHFIRTAAIGKIAMVRGLWNKKQSWRATAADPDREREVNWRLMRSTSLGLVGELGIHQIDVASWYLDARPQAVNGFGALVLWDDGRDVADTVQAVFEYPGRVRMAFNGSLVNSFEGETQVVCGSDAAILLRGNRAWLFKEADAPTWDWEVHAQRETLDRETGITLRADASKLKRPEAGAGPVELPPLMPPLQAALEAFAWNARAVTAAAEDFVANYGSSDPKALAEALRQINRRPAASCRDGYTATVVVIQAAEAISTGQRVEFKNEWFEWA
jgi:predicted dehydrogenase